MSAHGSIDPLDGGSDLSDTEGSSPPQTPGQAQTPGHEASYAAQSPSSSAKHAARDQERREGSRSKAAQSAKAPIRTADTAAKAKKRVKGWAYIEDDKTEPQASRESNNEADSLERNGRTLRRRSSAVDKAGGRDRGESGGIDAKHGESDVLHQSAPSKSKVTIKIKRAHGQKKGNGDSRADSTVQGVKPSQRTDKESDSDSDDMPAARKKRPVKLQKRGVKNVLRSRADDEEVVMDDLLPSDQDESMSDLATDSEDEHKAKKIKRVSSAIKRVGQGSSKHSAPFSSSQGLSKHVVAAAHERPGPLTPSSTSAKARPTGGIVPAGHSPSLARPSPRPIARPAIRKQPSGPSLLNNLMGFGPPPGSSTASRDATPSRNVTPRPRPPVSADSPATAGGKVRPEGGTSRSRAGEANETGGVSRPGATSSAGSRPGLNGDHITASEMQALREREMYRHEHPDGLFDLLENAEVMMEFEEKTRQELRHDAFLHKHKLYKPGRTEGVWKLVEHVKQRVSDGARDLSRDMSDQEPVRTD